MLKAAGIKVLATASALLSWQVRVWDLEIKLFWWLQNHACDDLAT